MIDIDVLRRLCAPDFLPENIRRISSALLQENILNSHDIQFLVSNPQSTPVLKHLASTVRLMNQRDRGLLAQNILSSGYAQSLLEGKISSEDIALDFATPKGRNEIAQKYAGLVQMIARMYYGKTRLSKTDLLSAGLEGLNIAINNYRKDNDKGASFKTYASNIIRFTILDEIKKNRDLSGSPVDKSALNALSLTQLTTSHDGEEGSTDKLGALGQLDEPKNYRDEQKHWDTFYARLESKFSVRDMDVFYRYFGLNGRKKEKSKDIAKSYGMSEGNIRNSIINKILKYIHSDPQTRELILDIQDLYTESLLAENYKTTDLEHIFANDETYLLLEDMSKLLDPRRLKNILKSALSRLTSPNAASEIQELLHGDYLDADGALKKDRKILTTFLALCDPSANPPQTDIDILDRLAMLQQRVAKYKIKI